MKDVKYDIKKTKCGEASKKGRYFQMYLNLNGQQFKTGRYSYRSTYINSMVTRHQKPIMFH